MLCLVLYYGQPVRVVVERALFRIVVRVLDFFAVPKRTGDEKRTRGIGWYLRDALVKEFSALGAHARALARLLHKTPKIMQHKLVNIRTEILGGPGRRVGAGHPRLFSVNGDVSLAFPTSLGTSRRGLVRRVVFSRIGRVIAAIVEHLYLLGLLVVLFVDRVPVRNAL